MIYTSALPLGDSYKPEYLEYHGILPLKLVDGELQVAVSREPTREVLDDLESAFGAPVVTRTISEHELSESVRAVFGAEQTTQSLVRSLDGESALGPERESSVPEAHTQDLINQPPVVRYVNLLIREAYEAGASDIHVESTALGAAVRFRLDGVMVSSTAPPDSIYDSVVSRLKLIADLDLADRSRASRDSSRHHARSR